MTNTKKTTGKVIATVLALVIALSSLSLITASSVSALSYEGSAQGNADQKTFVSVIDKTKDMNTTAKAYYFKALGKTKKGYDWTYKTNNDIFTVKCKYDFDAHKYTFKITGKAKGTAKIKLCYKQNDSTWVKVPMTIKVDAQKNITRIA